jgi:hypothetical protein
MRYKREEAFRFAFEDPISVFFSITEVNGISVTTSEGEAKLIDLSLSGMKLSSTLDIPISNQNQVKVYVRFPLNESAYMIKGNIIWRKEKSNSFYYGIQFYADENVQEELMKELKLYARRLKS